MNTDAQVEAAAWERHRTWWRRQYGLETGTAEVVAQQTWTPTLRKAEQEDMRAALAAAQAARMVPLDDVVKMTDNVSRVGYQQGYAAGIKAAATWLKAQTNAEAKLCRENSKRETATYAAFVEAHNAILSLPSEAK